MQYNKESLEAAIFYFVPAFEFSKDSGIPMSNAEMINSAIKECFLLSDGRDVTHSWPFKIAAHVLREAYRDIHDQGWFIFGYDDVTQDIT